MFEKGTTTTFPGVRASSTGMLMRTKRESRSHTRTCVVWIKYRIFFLFLKLIARYNFVHHAWNGAGRKRTNCFWNPKTCSRILIPVFVNSHKRSTVSWREMRRYFDDETIQYSCQCPKLCHFKISIITNHRVILARRRRKPFQFDSRGPNRTLLLKLH